MAQFKSSSETTSEAVFGCLGVILGMLAWWSIRTAIAAFAYNKVAPLMHWPELNFWQIWWLSVLTHSLIPTRAPKASND